MEITETVRKSIPENEETALSIVKGEIYKSINARLYSRDKAVTTAAYYIAKGIQDSGGDSERLYVGYLAEYVIEWIIGKRKPAREWIAAIFRHYNNNSLAVLIPEGSPKDNRVVTACSAWNGRKKFSFNTLRAEGTYFFRDRTAPKSIIAMAQALYYEKELGLQQIDVEDCIALAKWAYEQGKGAAV